MVLWRLYSLGILIRYRKWSRGAAVAHMMLWSLASWFSLPLMILELVSSAKQLFDEYLRRQSMEISASVCIVPAQYELQFYIFLEICTVQF
jgi:hypothetical protein